MTTLKAIRNKIESLQDSYRKIAAANRGVIRGAADSQEIGDRITALMAEYNERAKRTMYYGGKISKRISA